MFKKKADMGIGTLIIFIAMILVAAIAAGVLVQTATSLQNKALLAGERTKGQVSTSAQVLLLFAEDGSSGASVDRFFAKMKLSPGSDPIKFNDTLLEFDLQDTSADLIFNKSDGTCADWEYGTDSSSGSGNYSIEYLVTGPEWKNEYLHRGDVILLCFESPRAISSDEDISIRFIPKVGTPTILETSVPDIIGQTRIYVFP